MKNREVISYLRRGTAEAPAGALERCLAALAEVKRQNRLLPLIRLQLRVLPLWVYGLAVLSALCQAAAFAFGQGPDAMLISAVANGLTVLLLGLHLLFSSEGRMEEVERSCKYSFGQILLARVLCFCLLVGASQGAVLLVTLFLDGAQAKVLVGSWLPTLLGCLAALVWANYLSKNEAALMSVYLTAALLTGLMMGRMLALGGLFVCLLSLAALGAIFFQTKSLLNRMIPYETDAC